MLGGASTAFAADDAAARGAYLAAAAGCDQCHTDTAGGGAPYAGGRKLATEFGAITTPNITPDRATGIGGWSEVTFRRAMRYGLAPDGSHYVPAFPFPHYAGLSNGDIADLKAFLDTLPAVSRYGLGTADSPALIARAWAAVGVVAMTTVGAARSDPGRGGSVARGAFLVATVGRCGDCHTPRTWLGAPDPARELAGNGKRGPNITQDPAHGIGKWSEDDIVALLKDGMTPDGDFVGGAMTEIVRNTARLDDADRRAIAAYLRSLPTKSLAQNAE